MGNKQENLCTRLVLGGSKMSRSPYPPARILSFYRGFNGVSHIHCPDGLNNTLVSQGCERQVAPGMRTVGEMYLPRTGEGGNEPPIA